LKLQFITKSCIINNEARKWLKEKFNEVITSISDVNIHIYLIKFTLLSVICIYIWIRDKNFGATTLPLSSQYSIICNVDFFNQVWIKLYWMRWLIFYFCVAPKMDIDINFSKILFDLHDKAFSMLSRILVKKLRIPSVLMSADDKGTIRYRVYEKCHLSKTFRYALMFKQLPLSGSAYSMR
jgi:hypothetical protein